MSVQCVGATPTAKAKFEGFVGTADTDRRATDRSSQQSIGLLIDKEEFRAESRDLLPWTKFEGVNMGR